MNRYMGRSRPFNRNIYQGQQSNSFQRQNFSNHTPYANENYAASGGNSYGYNSESYQENSYVEDQACPISTNYTADISENQNEYNAQYTEGYDNTTGYVGYDQGTGYSETGYDQTTGYDETQGYDANTGFKETNQYEAETTDYGETTDYNENAHYDETTDYNTGTGGINTEGYYVGNENSGVSNDYYNHDQQSTNEYPQVSDNLGQGSAYSGLAYKSSDRGGSTMGRGFDRGGSTGRGFDRGGAMGRGFDRGGATGRGFDGGGTRGRGFDRGGATGREFDRGGAMGRGIDRGHALGRGSVRGGAMGRGFDRGNAIGKGSERGRGMERGTYRGGAIGRGMFGNQMEHNFHPKNEFDNRQNFGQSGPQARGREQMNPNAARRPFQQQRETHSLGQFGKALNHGQSNSNKNTDQFVQGQFNKQFNNTKENSTKIVTNIPVEKKTVGGNTDNIKPPKVGEKSDDNQESCSKEEKKEEKPNEDIHKEEQHVKVDPPKIHELANKTESPDKKKTSMITNEEAAVNKENAYKRDVAKKEETSKVDETAMVEDTAMIEDTAKIEETVNIEESPSKEEAVQEEHVKKEEQVLEEPAKIEEPVDKEEVPEDKVETKEDLDEDNESDSSEEDTGYCKYCKLNFSTPKAYHAHTRGLQHTTLVMQAKAEAGDTRFQLEQVEASVLEVQIPRPKAPLPETVENVYDVEDNWMDLDDDVIKYMQENKNPDDRDLNPEDVGKNPLPDNFFCPLCNVKCTGAGAFKMHIDGRQHNNNLEAAKQGAKLKRKKQASAGIMVQTTDRPSKFTTMIKDNHAPLLGLEYVTEFQKSDFKAPPRYVCNLCESKCDGSTIVPHVVGLKHRLKYMQVKKPMMYEHMTKFNSKKKKSEMNANLEDFANQIEAEVGRSEVKIKVELENYEDEDELKESMIRHSKALAAKVKELEEGYIDDEELPSTPKIKEPPTKKQKTTEKTIEGKGRTKPKLDSHKESRRREEDPYENDRRGTYSDTRRSQYDDPKRPSYEDPRRPSYHDPRRSSYHDPRRPSHDDPRKPSYDDARRPSYDDPRQPSYEDPRRPSYDDPRKPSYADVRRHPYDDPRHPSYIDRRYPYDDPRDPYYRRRYPDDFRASYRDRFDPYRADDPMYERRMLDERRRLDGLMGEGHRLTDPYAERRRVDDIMERRQYLDQLETSRLDDIMERKKHLQETDVDFLRMQRFMGRETAPASSSPSLSTEEKTRLDSQLARREALQASNTPANQETDVQVIQDKLASHKSEDPNMAVRQEMAAQALKEAAAKNPNVNIAELMGNMSSSMIATEDDAAMALQISNALTQALLKYRLQNVPKELSSLARQIEPELEQKPTEPSIPGLGGSSSTSSSVPSFLRTTQDNVRSPSQAVSRSQPSFLRTTQDNLRSPSQAVLSSQPSFLPTAQDNLRNPSQAGSRSLPSFQHTTQATSNSNNSMFQASISVNMGISQSSGNLQYSKQQNFPASQHQQYTSYSEGSHQSMSLNTNKQPQAASSASSWAPSSTVYSTAISGTTSAHVGVSVPPHKLTAGKDRESKKPAMNLSNIDQPQKLLLESIRKQTELLKQKIQASVVTGAAGHLSGASANVHNQTKHVPTSSVASSYANPYTDYSATSSNQTSSFTGHVTASANQTSSFTGHVTSSANQHGSVTSTSHVASSANQSGPGTGHASSSAKRVSASPYSSQYYKHNYHSAPPNAAPQPVAPPRTVSATQPPLPSEPAPPLPTNDLPPLRRRHNR